MKHYKCDNCGSNYKADDDRHGPFGCSNPDPNWRPSDDLCFHCFLQRQEAVAADVRKAAKSKEGIDPDYHPSQDTTDRCREDTLLRKAGFKIHSRPRTGEAVWSRKGKRYRHSQAVKKAGIEPKVFVCSECERVAEQCECCVGEV